ncbi:MAG: integrin alpha, partial [Planctomycetota bacterium]
MHFRPHHSVALAAIATLAPAVAAIQATEVAREDVERLAGALRHVQLLGVADGKVRFATSTLGGIALHERDLGKEVLLREPAAFLATEFPVLPMWTWHRRVPWRLVERGKDAWLVARNAEAREIVVQSFPSGDQVARIPDVSALEDARLGAAGIEILFRRDESIVLGEIDAAAAGEVETEELLDAGSTRAGATFVTGSSGAGAPPQTAVVATSDGRALVILGVDLEHGDVRRVATEIEQSDRTALRVAAREDGDDVLAVVGLPRHADQWGQVVLVALGPPTVSTCSPYGKPTVERHRIGWDCWFGQSVGVTADADGDGRPDVVVGASYGTASEHVDLVSSARSRSIRRFDSISFL